MSKIPRHKAAIRRSRLSQPARLATQRGIIQKAHTIFDYGCGYGTDAYYLSQAGYNVVGYYDPYYFPQNKIVSADIVLLSFVLSTIEDVRERDRTLINAYNLSRQKLIVSFLKDRHPQQQPFNDGYLTQRGTFEKCYTAKEAQDYLIAILGSIPTIIKTGIYVINSSNKVENISYCQSEIDKILATINDLKLLDLPPNPNAKIEQYKGGSSRKAYARWRWPDGYKQIGKWDSQNHRDAIEQFKRQQLINSLKRREQHIRKLVAA